MVQRLSCVVVTALVAALVGAGCASQPTEEADAAPLSCSEDDDCVQPPLRRDDLIEHLQENQQRILAREDYLQQLPPPISEVIYGPLPDGHLRAGEPIVDERNRPYSGELNWHRIGFEDVITAGADHGALRGRDVSGAHCLFARQPNRFTAVFALLVRHQRTGEDALYFGGPHQHVVPIESSPLTDGAQRRLRVDTDEQIVCAFRDDQNRHGALIVPIADHGGAEGSDSPRWAMFTLAVGQTRRPTGETTTVPRTTGLHGGDIVQVEVPMHRYPTPRIEYVDQFDELYDALEVAEEQIIPGDFRLRPEFVYPVMPYRSYLNTGNEEFCPPNARCETPPKYLDKDTLPPLQDYTDESAGDDDGE